MTSRRIFLGAALGGVAASALPMIARGDDAPRTIGLGFSLYGMRALSIADALEACAKIGYDAVELPVLPDWPGDSARLTADARRELRARLADLGLRLTALMENLAALGDDAQNSANLDRLGRACQLARDLKQGEEAPLVETILGSKPGEFEAVKDRLAQRLREWTAVAEAARVRLAIKAHVANATQRPEQLAWLLDQIASPWLVAAYDYSHFQLQGLELAGTLDALVQKTAFVHVKDSEHALGKRGFLLPGEGTIDYVDLFRRLVAGGYRGDVVVEVSGQVFGQPGYEPLVAAGKCYNHLAPAMAKAGVTRK